ncbi:MAG TPA: PRC-barrel domain-containing protein [Thermoanaerobaculia bacterium]|jgi:sporulation protein YlmC with PRC-barrel domain
MAIQTTAERRTLTASTLTGNAVRNSQGERLGKIEDFMLDLETGRIAYCVLSFGGFLGMGDKLFAVPWNAMTLDMVNHEFILDVPQERLKQAPGFDKDNWPDISDRQWGSRVFAFYNVAPYWE